MMQLAAALAQHQARFEELEAALARRREIEAGMAELAAELREVDETIRRRSWSLYDGMTVDLIRRLA